MSEIICTHLCVSYSSKCPFCGEYVKVFQEINGYMVEIMDSPIDWSNSTLTDSEGNTIVLNHDWIEGEK